MTLSLDDSEGKPVRCVRMKLRTQTRTADVSPLKRILLSNNWSYGKRLWGTHADQFRLSEDSNGARLCFRL